MIKMGKVFGAEEVPKRTSPDGKRDVLAITEYAGSKTMIGSIIKMRPGAQAVPYHYHQHREVVYYFLNGKAKAILEDGEYHLAKNGVVYLAPGEKHTIIPEGDEELVYMEFAAFTPGRDYIEAELKR